MRIFFIVCGALIIAGGLLLLIVSALLGLVFIALGGAFLFYGIRYKKPEPIAQTPSAPMQPEPVAQPVRQMEPTKHTILVAGFDHHQDALRSLLVEHNPYYDFDREEILEYCDVTEQIFEYERAIYPLHIQAEPDNPYDPNAIKVFAGSVFIGYVPRGGFPEIQQCMAHNPVCSVEVFGGRFKYLEYDEEADYLGEMDDKYFRLRTDSTPVKAIMVFQWY